MSANVIRIAAAYAEAKRKYDALVSEHNEAESALALLGIEVRKAQHEQHALSRALLEEAAQPTESR